MASFNQVTFVGRLGRDPEMNYTPSGKAVTRFSLAVDQGKDQKAMWLNITCWDELAERMNTWLHKGILVLVQGRLQLRSYTDKSNIERVAVDIIASSVQVLEKAQAAATPSPAEVEEKEDVPF